MRFTKTILIVMLGLGAGALTALAQDKPAAIPGMLSKTLPSSALPQQGPKATVPNRPNTYGTTATSYYKIPASEFSPVSLANDTYIDTFYNGGPNYTYRRYATTANSWFIASPHLPSGALLTNIGFDDCGGVDNSHTVHALIWECDSIGNCGTGPVQTLNATSGCGQDGFDVSGLAYTVVNGSNYLIIQIAFDSVIDGSVNFSGFVVGYQLQVTPAPGTATFNDVPVSDPAFRYIEAFNAAAITAGCSVSPPLYCPDNFVTRRQMAVFFAKALGLQFQ